MVHREAVAKGIRKTTKNDGTEYYQFLIPQGTSGQANWSTERFESQEEARAERVKFHRYRETHGGKAIPSLDMVFDGFLQAKRRRAGTIVNLENKRKGISRFIDLNTYVNRLSPSMVQTIFDTMERARNEDGTPQFSPGTIHLYYQTLKGVCAYAIKKGHLKENPCNDIKLPEKTHRKFDSFTAEEIGAVVKALLDKSINTPSPRLATMYKQCAHVLRFLFVTGLRANELAQLEKKKADYRNGTITFLGKTGMHDNFHINREAIESLQTLAELNPDSAYFLPGKDPIKRRTWIDSRFTNAISNVIKWGKLFQVDGRKLVPHSCRHSFCYNHVRNGTSPFLLSKLARHKNINQTLRYYEGRTDDYRNALETATLKLD